MSRTLALPRLLAVAILPVLMAACQEGRELGAVSYCDASIEVAVQDVPNPSSDELYWRTLEPGSGSSLVTTGSRTTKAYYWIRMPGDEQPAPVEIAISTLVKPESDSGFDLGLIIEGPLCPG